MMPEFVVPTPRAAVLLAVSAIVCVGPLLFASPAASKNGLEPTTRALLGKPFVEAELTLTKFLALPVKSGAVVPPF